MCSVYNMYCMECLYVLNVTKVCNGCNLCALNDMTNKKIKKSKEKFFNDIKIKDNENRWDYSIAETEYSGTNNNITLICNGCKIC